MSDKMPERTDTDRLQWMASQYIFDGFANVEQDIYEFIMDVQYDDGTGETTPTPAQELEGFRRLLDAAMDKEGRNDE